MPSKYCDIVMKGGITSGVVYPLAITELADEYKFKNIGGTSAGAIAAVLTAAAEYGRRSRVTGAFETVKELPKELSQKNFLLTLFQPSREASRVFHVFQYVLKFQSKSARIVAAVLALLGQFWIWAIAGGILVAIIPILIGLSHDLPIPTNLILASVWALVGVVLAVLIGAFRNVATALGKDGFGACSGLATGNSPGLTGWLNSKIQQAAGKQTDAQPLTFGDLWTAKADEWEPLTSGRVINLLTVTTNVTEGRPYTLPFETHRFYFDPQELSSFFPPSILTWMVNHPAPPDKHPVGSVISESGATLVHFPDGKDIPILVAARMSLSFPVLLKAVPLYAVDYSLKKNQTPGVSVTADRCWFSDGGICSNFPMHFFDSPIPRWPTFGINLKSPHPDHNKTEADMVWLPTKPSSGSQVEWNRFDPGTAGGSVLTFLGAIINTMQNWRDNLQSTAPGYQDRIVHISLRDNEGGLNLNMSPGLIKTLSQRGATAGQLLKTEFNFCNHLWLRYRLTMCSMQNYLGNLSNSWSNSVPQQDCGRDFILSIKDPEHYAGERTDRGQLYEALKRLLQVSQEWQGNACKTSPRPVAELRGQPRF